MPHAEDDPKGMDIRFRRVVAGTPEGKDMVWTTLIKFADRRAKPAPRKLAADVAAAVGAGGQLQAGSGSGRTITPPVVSITGPASGNGAGYSSPPSVSFIKPPADPDTLPPLAVSTDPVWIAGDLVRTLLQTGVTNLKASRDPSAGTRQNVYLTLRHVTKSEDNVRAFCLFVFGHASYKALSGAVIWALHGVAQTVHNQRRVCSCQRGRAQTGRRPSWLPTF